LEEDTTFQEDGSGKEAAGLKQDGAAAGGGASVNGGLNGLGVQVRAIADGATVADVQGKSRGKGWGEETGEQEGGDPGGFHLCVMWVCCASRVWIGRRFVKQMLADFFGEIEWVLCEVSEGI